MTLPSSENRKRVISNPFSVSSPCAAVTPALAAKNLLPINRGIAGLQKQAWMHGKIAIVALENESDVRVVASGHVARGKKLRSPIGVIDDLTHHFVLIARGLDFIYAGEMRFQLIDPGLKVLNFLLHRLGCGIRAGGEQQNTGG